ncbi:MULTISPECIES: sulfurtransferase complex subunit TusB [Erwinia]|uniref:Protein TusB n=1 Tax=Erwinia pyrifoliae TaxID=79967 RepID=A0ABY5X8M4_ERWPY|nr:MULTISPECIES: sulfurtransferase complex subunit TusB [Erwinia]ADP10554.1 sulfur transfer complex subunit TusB [Erwinia sp. Ejp617]AUX71302.1 sulfurtransferase TusB [Erwinia pyrifoliae]MCA8874978.1 sulfurtransferase complex subunit TusB [Erwinia pyrifoliae]MCT2385704.1 sulfurtransferase complex subunit TusB [Erwinia pyrifoliae]MCU8588720.1 sulfurtransferase complex subunit TusB [Erwinia pyrifoliae]
MLHTLMTSPFRCDLPAILRLLAAGDDVLLLQDGVIAALEGSVALEALLKAPINLYALKEDLEARGLLAQISSRVTVIGYTDFVQLTVRNLQQMAW